MTSGKKLTAIAAALAIITTPLFGSAGQARPYHRHYVYGPLAPGYGIYGLGYGYGTGWYGTGWRWRDNARGWDNTCLDVPWLPSQFACSPK